MDVDNDIRDTAAGIFAILGSILGDDAKEPPPEVADYLRSDLGITDPGNARTFYNIVIIFRDAYGLDNLPLRLLDIIESVTILEAGPDEPTQ